MKGGAVFRAMKKELPSGDESQEMHHGPEWRSVSHAGGISKQDDREHQREMLKTDFGGEPLRSGPV